MSAATDWQFSITDAFHAAFYIEDATESRPGIEWLIEARAGARRCRLTIRGVFAEGLGEKTRADHRYQAGTCLGFLADLADEGTEFRDGQRFLIEIHEPEDEDVPPFRDR